jgi:hypothetical protein
MYKHQAKLTASLVDIVQQDRPPQGIHLNGSFECNGYWHKCLESMLSLLSRVNILITGTLARDTVEALNEALIHYSASLIELSFYRL